MRNWVSKAAIAVALGGGMLAIPALGQDSPESLLPPGFGTPAPARAPAAPTPLSPPTAPAAPDTATVVTDDAPVVTGDADSDVAAADDAAEADVYRLPPPVSRPIDHVGAIGPGSSGFPADAFDGADGEYLVRLMHRLDMPIASRWVAIVLRRALLSSIPTARGLNPADWVAERALLLTRMGDVDGARMLVQAVPIDRYTPRLYAVAAQVALASADIGGLCPIADVGQSLSREPLWLMARAMCAGLSGDSSLAAALLDDARQKKRLGDLDLLLAERVSSAAIGDGKSVNIDWNSVKRLNVYRFGLATAAGVGFPGALLRTVGPQVMAWQGRAPGVPMEQRIAAARTGAAIGIFSSRDLVDLYSAQAEDTDPFAIAGTPAGLLRKAYVETDTGQRIEALEKLWKGNPRSRDGYAGRILTARAAMGIAPDESLLDKADGLIGSMLSAGLDRQAMRWWPLVAAGDETDTAEAWALLAVAAPRPMAVSEGRIKAFANRDDSVRGRHRAALLVAALAGLGRIEGRMVDDLSSRYGADLEGMDRYLRRLDEAAVAGRGGEVALLAAIGMQTEHWSGVPPRHLFHILSALRRVGREPEARMIAAEALMRS